MTLAKGTNPTKRSIVAIKSKELRIQAIVFGAIISTIASASAIGYIAYVSNPTAQEYFLRLIYG
tara:strand:+ start:43 stop:234 length:192 start_codon:yes stop_codon:yes gene_type:complete